MARTWTAIIVLACQLSTGCCLRELHMVKGREYPVFCNDWRRTDCCVTNSTSCVNGSCVDPSATESREYFVPRESGHYVCSRIARSSPGGQTTFEVSVHVMEVKEYASAVRNLSMVLKESNGRLTASCSFDGVQIGSVSRATSSDFESTSSARHQDEVIVAKRLLLLQQTSSHISTLANGTVLMLQRMHIQPGASGRPAKLTADNLTFSQPTALECVLITNAFVMRRRILAYGTPASQVGEKWSTAAYIGGCAAAVALLMTVAWLLRRASRRVTIVVVMQPSPVYSVLSGADASYQNAVNGASNEDDDTGIAAGRGVGEQPLLPAAILSRGMQGRPVDSCDAPIRGTSYTVRLPPEALAREVTSDSFEILEQIGSGNYGVVHRGRLRASDREVAVKSIHENATVTEMTSLVLEACLMLTVESHRNVLGVIGTCLLARPPLIFTDFCQHGDLRSYLRSLQPPFEAFRLKVFSLDIARGMEHLNRCGIIHRDLAARNVLVDSEYTCKVSDFGLSRRATHKDCYRATRDSPLAQRWLAPEVFLELKFTAASDMWSFGVTLWEIYSLGEQPYADMPSESVAPAVCNGLRLGRPLNACDRIFSIMTSCWHADAANRPTFQGVARALEMLEPGDVESL